LVWSSLVMYSQSLRNWAIPTLDFYECILSSHLKSCTLYFLNLWW
jgi:hypothetical protein